MGALLARFANYTAEERVHSVEIWEPTGDLHEHDPPDGHVIKLRHKLFPGR